MGGPWHSGLQNRKHAGGDDSPNQHFVHASHAHGPQAGLQTVNNTPVNQIGSTKQSAAADLLLAGAHTTGAGRLALMVSSSAPVGATSRRTKLYLHARSHKLLTYISTPRWNCSYK